MGFTLTEMMVTIIIMMIVFFALYSIFDMTLKVFSFGNNKVEATESARIGMEKMEREIRQAYRYRRLVTDAPVLRRSDPAMPFCRTSYHPPLISPSATNWAPPARQITCVTPTSCEYITYKLTNADGTTPCSGATCTLWRENGSKSGP